MSGRCVCCLGKDSLVMRLQAVLKSWFCKGGLGRASYSLQGAVFCLSRAGIPDDCARWFFVGCGDLRYSWFITQELVPCRQVTCQLPGLRVLECISSGPRARPHPLFTLDVDSNVPWHVQAMQDMGQELREHTKQRDAHRKRLLQAELDRDAEAFAFDQIKQFGFYASFITVLLSSGSAATLPGQAEITGKFTNAISQLQAAVREAEVHSQDSPWMAQNLQQPHP